MIQTPFAAWLAQGAAACQTECLAGLDSTASAEQGQVLDRLLAGEGALVALAEGLVDRGVAPAAAARAVTAQLAGNRARDLRRFMPRPALEQELLVEARMLAEGGPDLWADFIGRFADLPVDGVLAAVIRHAGDEAVPALLALVLDEDQRDPDSESNGYAPIHAARFLAERTDPRVVEPLLDLLPELVPGEPLIDAVEAALHAFGDGLMAPALAHIEAAEDDETRLALWMLLARSEIDDDRIRDALVALLPQFPDEAAWGLSIYGDVSVLPAVVAAFDALSDENPFQVADLAGSIRDLGGELNPEQAERAERAHAAALARLEAEKAPAEPAAPSRRPLSATQKKAAQAKKKVQRQMKKKSRPKKKK